jgi:hypothetical protein
MPPLTCPGRIDLAFLCANLALTLKLCRVSITGARQCFMAHRQSVRLQSF